MSHARRSIGTVLVIAVPALLIALGMARHTPAASMGQAMSHKRHLAKEMKCRACHQGVEGQALASFPTLADCMDCHKMPQGNDPAEPSVRARAARGDEISWGRLNRLAGHVYFSHAAHVTLASMKCEDCHQDMTAIDQPTAPDIRPDMDGCVACHREKHASVDCLACHK